MGDNDVGWCMARRQPLFKRASCPPSHTPLAQVLRHVQLTLSEQPYILEIKYNLLRSLLSLLSLFVFTRTSAALFTCPLFPAPPPSSSLFFSRTIPKENRVHFCLNGSCSSHSDPCWMAIAKQAYQAASSTDLVRQRRRRKALTRQLRSRPRNRYGPRPGFRHSLRVRVRVRVRL